MQYPLQHASFIRVKSQITSLAAWIKELNKNETKQMSNYFNSNAELTANDLNTDDTL